MKVNARFLRRAGVIAPALAAAVPGAFAALPAPAQDAPQAATRPSPPASPLPRSAAPPAPLITEGVTFAPIMQFEKGQERRYGTQSSLTFRFPGQNGGPSAFASTSSMTLTMRFRALDTRPDGSVTVQALTEGGRLLDATGAYQNIAREPDNTPHALTLDRQDRIIAFRDPAGKSPRGNAGGGLDALFNQSNLLIPLDFLPLPDREARVGESWTARYATLGKKSANAAGTARNTKDAPNDPSPDVVPDEVTATLTLLGREKIGDTDTIKVRQVLTVPYTAYTDAQGKPSEARNAKGRIVMRLIFTQMVNALPQSGLMVRSQGLITGTVQFAGALLAQLPGDTMTVSGQLLAVRLDDSPAPADPTPAAPAREPR